MSRSGYLEVGGRQASWVADGELDGRPVMLFSHGAGAPYTSDFMVEVANRLVYRGIAVVRFHFPYMETMQREGRRRGPDRAPVCLDTWAAMIEVARDWGPLVLSGKSMGGRMASMLLADGRGEPARGAVYFGYPLHPAGKPDRLRKDHLPDVPVPQLFVTGTKDKLCQLELLEPVIAELGDRARLHLVEGGDHSLAPSRKEPFRNADQWLDVTAKFVREVTV